MINGPGSAEKHILLDTSAEAGRRAVDSLVDGGATSIKVQNTLSRDAFFAIA